MYGALIPNEMINQDTKDSKSYKTYLEFATGKTTPKKVRKFKKVASPLKKLSPVLEEEPAKKPKRAKKPAKKSNTAPTAGVVIRDTPAALLEVAQLKKTLKKSKLETHKLHASGLGDGVGSQPKSESENESWGNSKDDDSNDDVTNDDDDDNDGESDDDGDNEGSDSEKTDSNEDENLNLNQNDDEEEEYEEEEYVCNPDNYEFTNDDEEYEELYKDVNVRLRDVEHDEEGKKDAEKTVVGHDADNPSPADTEMNSMMNIDVRHEEPSTQTPPLLTIPVTVILETSSAAAQPCPRRFSPLLPNPQTSTPTPAPTTKSTTTSIPALPDFSSLFEFDQRVSVLEKELSQLKQVDYSVEKRISEKRMKNSKTDKNKLEWKIMEKITSISNQNSTVHSLLVGTPTPTPTTETTTTSIPALLDFSSLFGFDQRVSILEKELSQLKQVDYSTQLLESIKSQILAIVDAQLSTRLEDYIQKTFRSYTAKFEKKDKDEKKRYIDLVEKSVKKIIKDEVKSQLPQILPKEVSEFATPVIKSTITESLENVVLAKSSSQPKSTYEVAVSLTKFELKKIILDKDLFESYGKAYSLKRDREDKHKDKDPPDGSVQGLKRRKTRKDVKPSKGSKSKELKTSSSKSTKSQPKSSERDWFKKPKRPPTPDSDWNATKSIDFRPPQPWINKITKAKKPPLTFDELMSTPIDFSAYVMNNLKIDNLTQEHLVGPAFNLLKRTCRSRVKLEYHFEECYKAVTNRLDWNNPEGQEYLFDLSKPL
ncbi:hypothetical protein Tco_1241987, partial [Tanacetum coccineum]